MTELFTKKAKSQFFKWYENVFVKQNSFVNQKYYSDLDYLSPEMKWGIILAFADYMTFDLDVYNNGSVAFGWRVSRLKEEECVFYSTPEMEHKNYVRYRSSAQIEAIQKMNQLINEEKS